MWRFSALGSGESELSMTEAQAGQEARSEQDGLWVLSVSPRVCAGQLAGEAVSVANLSVSSWHSLKAGRRSVRRRSRLRGRSPGRHGVLSQTLREAPTLMSLRFF